MHQISGTEEPNDVANNAANQEQLFHKAMHYFRNGMIFANLYGEKYMDKEIESENPPNYRSSPQKNPPPFSLSTPKQSDETSKIRLESSKSVNMNQLKAEVDGLRSRIENGKSNFGLMTLGLGALGIWGLGILTYATVKMIKNAVRRTQENKSKEWNIMLNEGTYKDNGGVDPLKLIDKGKARLHARDIKLSLPE